ncbi:hypothetical protein [Nannocystis pusilla]|uniref:hypothetical protein n=1 Tax=Nannocystis pusilla TaxID=889268 RepID=UPI003B76CCBE
MWGTFNINLEDATIEQWGIIFAAGMAAQLWGIQTRNGWRDEDPQTIKAWETVWPQGIKDRDDFLSRGGTMDQFRECFNKARQLVRQQWRLIQMLTLELLEHRIVYQDDFRLIVTAYEKDDKDLLFLLDVYRKVRREVEIPGDESFDDFRKNFPEVPWVEGFKDFGIASSLRKASPLPPGMSV